MANGIYNSINNPFPYKKRSNIKDRTITPNLNLEAFGNKVPPHSNEAEIAVLGAMMLEKNAVSKIIEILEVDSFYSEIHRKIYETILEMFDKKINVDILTLGEELYRRNLLDFVGGTFYLSEINAQTATAANVEYHARIIQERYLKRLLIATAANILIQGYDESTDALEEIDLAESEIFKIAEKRFHKTYMDINPLAHKTMNLIAKLAERDKHSLTGVPSGFKKLDDLLGGFQKSDFIVIAGRPSMGKTALALSIARNTAVEYGQKVAFFSIEMAATQLIIRLLSAEANVNSNDIRTGKISQESLSKIARTIGRIADCPMIIDDSPSLTIMEIRAKCRRMLAEMDSPVDLIVIDYLQLVQSPKAESREREISIISQSFKQMAKELDIPVIALAQLNRGVESRSDKRPMLSDLRESGSIEQDADVVLFIHRPEYYGIKTYDDDKSDTTGTAEIIVGKQRNGPVGTVRVAFKKEFARFDNLEFRYDEPPAVVGGQDYDYDEADDGPGF